MLASMPAFTACEEDDSEPQHDTTYTFGFQNFGLTDAQVQASADSSQVRNVILQSDEKSMCGISSTRLRTLFLDSKFAVPSKVKGRGSLNHLWIENKPDSLWLVQHGFTVNQNGK